MRERTVKFIYCVECGNECPWPYAFPSSIFAECYDCAWKRHVELKHKPKRTWWSRFAIRSPH